MATAETAKRGRAKKSDFMAENNFTSLSSVPKMPEEYNPDEHVRLKEGDFEDDLVYCDYMVACHNYHIARWTRKREKLASIPVEQRATVSKAQDACDSLLAQVRKLQANDVDISDIIATLQSGLTN